MPVPEPGGDEESSNTDGQWDPRAAGEDLLRTAFDVALLEYADDEERARISGAYTATITFTLRAGNPAWFSQPVTLIDTRHPDQYPPAAVRDVIPNYRIDAVAACPAPTDCLAASPYLAAKGPWGDEPFPGSNPVDPLWRDPGWPVTPFNARRAVYASPGDITPEWLEKVPVIEFYSGRSDMHRVTIRFYENPRNKPVQVLDPCDAVNEITLPWVPNRTKVRLDGRTRSVEVKCPDGATVSSDVVLYGPLGRLLEWPVFDCGMPMIIEVIGQEGTVAPDSWYKISWAAKADAI